MISVNSVSTGCASLRGVSGVLKLVAAEHFQGCRLTQDMTPAPASLAVRSSSGRCYLGLTRELHFGIGQGDWTRTSGLSRPRGALYQTKLHPDGDRDRIDRALVKGRVAVFSLSSLRVPRYHLGYCRSGHYSFAIVTLTRRSVHAYILVGREGVEPSSIWVVATSQFLCRTAVRASTVPPSPVIR